MVKLASKKKKQPAIGINSNLYPTDIPNRKSERLQFIRIIHEYLQPKIGRKIRIFSMGHKNNILIETKECMAPQAMNLINRRKWLHK